MNSLNDLNQLFDTVVFDDQRFPNVVADIFQNSFDILISQGQQHTAPNNFRVEELINPQLALPSFKIDLRSVPGATAVFPDIPDELEWTVTSSLSSSDWGTANVNAVIWNGSIFCAVGDGGRVATSADGKTWTFRPSLRDSAWGTTGNVLSIAWNESIFCAVGAAGRIATSPDGINWTYQPGLINTGLWSSQNCNAVVWRSGVSPSARFVIGGGQGRIAHSTDGITWAISNSLRSTAWGTTDSVRAFAFNGSNLICAVGDNGRVATSSDGITWFYISTLRSTSWGTTARVRSIAWNGSFFCAVGDDGRVATSNSNAATWTYRDGLRTTAWGTTSEVNAVIFKDSKFYAVGDSGSVATSSDGVTWNYRPSLSTTTWATKQCLAIAWNGQRLVVMGADTAVATGVDMTLIVTNPEPEVFVVTGFREVAEFDRVKTARIVLPNDYFGEFSYQQSIEFNGGISVSGWTTNVTVLEVNALTQPSNFTYTSGTTQSITGVPLVVFEGTPVPTWQLTITPGYPEAVTTITSAGTGGTVNFNNTTKVYTITGNTTQVNSHLNTLSFTAATGTLWDYAWDYDIIDLGTNEVDSTSQNFINIENQLLELNRNTETYQINTDSAISGGPRISHISDNINALYTMQVSSTDSNAVEELAVIENDQTFGFINLDDYEWDFDSTYQDISIDSLGNTTLLVKSKRADPSVVYRFIMYRNGNTWSTPAEFTLSAGVFEYRGQFLINGQGDTIAVEGRPSNGSNTKNVYIYKRSSGNTWTLEHTFTKTFGTGYQNTFGNRISINHNGTIVAISAPHEDKVYVYQRELVSGNYVWNLQQEISSPITDVANNFGFEISLSGSGSVLAITNFYSDGVPHPDFGDYGYCYIYRKSGNTWSLSDTLNPTVGSKRYVPKLDNTGNTMLLSNPKFTVNYETYSLRVGIVYGLEFIDNAWTIAFQTLGPAGQGWVDGEFATRTRLSISNDGTIATFSQPNVWNNQGIGAVYIWRKRPSNGQWYFATGYTNPNPPLAYIGQSVAISGDSSQLVIGVGISRQEVDENNVQTNYSAINFYFRNSITWDDVAKVLTMSGTKTLINTAIDNIVLTPKTNFNSDFDLKYQATIPDSQTVSRLQRVNKI